VAHQDVTLIQWTPLPRPGSITLKVQLHLTPARMEGVGSEWTPPARTTLTVSAALYVSSIPALRNLPDAPVTSSQPPVSYSRQPGLNPPYQQGWVDVPVGRGANRVGFPDASRARQGGSSRPIEPMGRGRGRGWSHERRGWGLQAPPPLETSPTRLRRENGAFLRMRLGNRISYPCRDNQLAVLHLLRLLTPLNQTGTLHLYPRLCRIEDDLGARSYPLCLDFLEDALARFRR
jgi:hypothetical protein